MLTIALLALYVGVALLASRLPGDRVERLTPAYPALAWIPAGLSVALMLLWGPLGRWLSYGVILLVVFVSAISLGAAMLGLRLCGETGPREKARRVLMLSTLVAALPFIIAFSSGLWIPAVRAVLTTGVR